MLCVRRRKKMKFITVRDIRTSPARIWKELPDEREMVITHNGKPIALLTPLSDSNLEETLSELRRARAIHAVKEMQQKARKDGIADMSIEDIDAEIQKTRKKKK